MGLQVRRHQQGCDVRIGIRISTAFTFVLPLAMSAACAGPERIELTITATQPGGAPFNYSDWGLTLSRAIRDDGVDYARLAQDPGPIDRFLVRLATTGPESTPDAFPAREARLAYVLNAHNAALVRSVVALCRDGQPPATAPARLDRRFAFEIDGRRQTPAELRAEAIRLAGDDRRVRLAMTTCRRTGPPLFRRPFLPEMLDAGLDLAAREALTSDQVIRIDHELQHLLVWRELYDLRGELIREYEARHRTRAATLLNVLLDWSDRPRREFLNSAIGYTVRAMPESREINVPRLPAAGSGLGF